LQRTLNNSAVCGEAETATATTAPVVSSVTTMDGSQVEPWLLPDVIAYVDNERRAANPDLGSSKSANGDASNGAGGTFTCN